MKARRSDYKMFDIHNVEIYHATALDSRGFFEQASRDLGTPRSWSLLNGVIISGADGRSLFRTFGWLVGAQHNDMYKCK